MIEIRHAVAWLAVLALASCKGGADKAPAAGSGSGSAAVVAARGSGSAAAAGSGSSGGSAAAATGSGSAAGSGSASAGSNVVAVVGGLQFDPDDANTDKATLAAFPTKQPRLPALSGDGQTIAELGSPDEMPSVLPPLQWLALEPLDGKGKVEKLPLVDAAIQAAAAKDTTTFDQPFSAPVAKLLKANADAILARLAAGGFESLVHVVGTTDPSVTWPPPPAIGDVTFVITDVAGNAKQNANSIDIAMRQGNGPPTQKHRVGVTAHIDNGADDGCGYQLIFRDAYTDVRKQHAYLWFSYHYNDSCVAPPHLPWIVFDLPPTSATGAISATGTPPASTTAAPSDVAAVTQLVANQFDRFSETGDIAKLGFAADAVAVGDQGIGTISAFPAIVIAPRDTYSGHKDANVQVTLSADGKSAWATGTTTLTSDSWHDGGAEQNAVWRFVDVLARDTTGWKIVAWDLTEPTPNAQANADAKAGKPTQPPYDAPPGDASLRAAFTKLTTDGVDATAVARAELVAIGSGPGERTVGGAALAPGWNAGWKGKTTVGTMVAHTTPSGTTGWVAAQVKLQKTGYQIAFGVFAVYDKTATGDWSLAAISFSVL